MSGYSTTFSIQVDIENSLNLMKRTLTDGTKLHFSQFSGGLHDKEENS